MKKLLLLSLYLTIAGAMVYAQSVTVTSPNGGESWIVGSSHNISWTSSGVSENVKLKLYKGGVSFGAITSNTADDGSYNWPIPASLNGHTLTAGSDYIIRLETVSENATDESDGNFTISSPAAASLTLTSPNGDESWIVGSSHNISWTSSGVSENVKLKLYKGGVSFGPITSNTADDGSYNWPIPASLNGHTLTAGSDYIIRLETVSENATDESDGNFTISSPAAASLTLTSPNGDESWIVGSSHNITWRSSGVSENVKLKLYKGGVSFGPITSNTADDGSYNWPIPASLNGHTLTAGSDYIIRLETVSENATDESDGSFTIAKAGSSWIKVTSPTSMWSFNAGGKMTVKWRTSGITGNVMITLHDKNGNQVFLVKSSHPYNKSPYRFSIPDNLGTGKYHIIISQGNIFGKSGNFTINKKTHTIQILHPARNASYLRGKVCTITWHSHNIPDNFVNIWLHPIGINSIAVIRIARKAANKEGRNSYSWRISKSRKVGNYRLNIEDTSRKYSGMSGKFKILASRKCDLALVDVKYCGKDIVATIKNLGDHYVGKIVLNLQMPHLKPTPFFKTFPGKKIALFRNKSITIKYKKPYYTQIKYRANFILNLSTDKEHTDQNPKNNLFAGRVYGGCKPDLSVRALHSGKDGPSKVGDNLKLKCQIENMGGEVKTPWVLRLEIKTRAGVVIHVKEWTFRIFDMATKHEYKYKIPRNVTRGGYNFATWCVDFYNRIDEEKENNQCASLGFMVK